MASDLSSGIIPTIQNVVSTADLGCKIDREYLAVHANNSEYNPNRSGGAAVVMRIRQPKTTALIFASGKMVCSGAKSEEESLLAARKYARIVKKVGHPLVKLKNFKIINIVASCDVKFSITLDTLAVATGHTPFISFQPEVYPGLKYRMSDPKVAMLIFRSGKIVITGAKDREEIYRAFQNIYPTLATKFMKAPSPERE